MDGTHAGAESEARLGPVHLGESCGHGVGGGVLEAGVGVARPLEPDELGIVVHVLRVEGGRLVDGHRCRALFHVRYARRRLDGACTEAALLLVRGHELTVHRAPPIRGRGV